MRTDYSRTAEGVALVRALQKTVPTSQRILDDPYAAAFLQHPMIRRIARSRVIARLMSRFLDYWAMGGQEFIAIRARLADDLAKEAVSEGLQQLVMLGAGFDSMVLRVGEALREVTVFEVDHPATQAIKCQVMTQIGVPANVQFVAVDFEKDDFVERLKEAGFDGSQRTLVIWMGVSYYLTPQAMARALEQIHALGGEGTRLTFDYIVQDVIDGTTRNRAALKAARRVAGLGEPWIFGLRPEELKNYLAAFGFKVIKDYDPEELRQRYCPQRSAPIDYARMVVCECVPAVE